MAYWPTSFLSGEIQYTTVFNPPSAQPHIYIPFTDKMGFLERCVNVWYGIGNHLVMQVLPHSPIMTFELVDSFPGFFFRFLNFFLLINLVNKN